MSLDPCDDLRHTNMNEDSGPVKTPVKTAFLYAFYPIKDNLANDLHKLLLFSYVFFFKLWFSSLISSDNKKLCIKLNQPVLGSNSRHCSSQPLLAQRNEREGSFHSIFMIKRFWK